MRDIAHGIVRSVTDKKVWMALFPGRKEFKSKMRLKMKEFFLNNTQSFFGAPLKFLDFYKSVIKIKNLSSSQ